jgi:hypothetical protein
MGSLQMGFPLFYALHSTGQFYQTLDNYLDD